MTPEQYDAWYSSPRGRWIGELEFRLLASLLDPAPGETLLDAGCGTGYFSRSFAAQGTRVTGIDPDPAMLGVAVSRRQGTETYLVGDARRLPFPDCSFDLCMAVTSLCFIAEETRAVAETLRVTRRRLALGLLNRRSLLYFQKGRSEGRGAYRGARWHTAREAQRLFAQFPVRDVRVRSAVFFPGGSWLARCAEQALPERLPLGAFLAAVAEVGH